ncbi:MAG: HEAT repeat domain-containing protein [Planctomycetaceae bacterium]
MKSTALVGYMSVASVLCSTLYAVERLPTLTSAMDSDPQLAIFEDEYYLPNDWADLWRAALISPEEDLRREAAIALMRLHQMGAADITQMNDAMLDGCRTATNDAVRLSIAAALIQLDVRESAADLYDFTKSGNHTVSRMIEPALARWQFEPIQDVWLARVRRSSSVTATHLVLAAEGLAAAKRTDAVPGLLELVLDGSSSTEVRFAASAALGSLTSAGLTGTSRKLASDQSEKNFVNRLIAAKLLIGHDGPEAEQLMFALAQDQRPAVAATALRHLLEVNPESVHPIADQLLTRDDAEVRRLAAMSLVNRATEESVERLANLLNDPHPNVRHFVRESLQHQMQTDALAPVILQQAERVLAGADWRGLEQAARLLGQVDHEPAAARLIDLLDHARMEVGVTAAWSLRELAVPDALPAIEAFMAQKCDSLPLNPLQSTGAKLDLRNDACLWYLFETVGQAKRLSAAPVLVKFVPKRGDMGARSRASAIWALGHIYANAPPDELVRQLISRMGDASLIQPEYPEVRAAAAISLGRMHSVQAVEPMQSAMAEMRIGGREYEACQWAISRIQGTPPPVSRPRQRPPQGPFLRSTRR